MYGAERLLIGPPIELPKELEGTMSELLGFAPPLTATGRTALVPPPPWHYSGDLLTVEYRTDPERVRALLPADLELAEEDPGAVAFLWADWQSCSDGGEELLDPARSQYKEAFVVVRCRFEGRTYSRCVLIWVTTDFAIARGVHQGYPKKLGSISMTRPILRIPLVDAPGDREVGGHPDEHAARVRPALEPAPDDDEHLLVLAARRVEQLLAAVEERLPVGPGKATAPGSLGELQLGRQQRPHPLRIGPVLDGQQVTGVVPRRRGHERGAPGRGQRRGEPEQLRHGALQLLRQLDRRADQQSFGSVQA